MKRTGISTPSLTSLVRSSSTESSKSRSLPKLKKNLSFSEDLCRVQFVECLTNSSPDAKNTIWYDGRELGGMRKKEIKKAKHAQILAGAGNPIESEDTSWRGFEDIQGQWCRVEKSAEYTTAVVRHYHSQVHQGCFDADELKKIAKGLSKQERARARNLALKDMADAGIRMDRKSCVRKSQSSIQGSTSASNSRKERGQVKKTLSGAGLASLRKSGSSGMLRLTKSINKVTAGTNFQWRTRKSGQDVAPTSPPRTTPPTRVAVLTS